MKQKNQAAIKADHETPREVWNPPSKPQSNSTPPDGRRLFARGQFGALFVRETVVFGVLGEIGAPRWAKMITAFTPWPVGKAAVHFRGLAKGIGSLQ